MGLRIRIPSQVSIYIEISRDNLNAAFYSYSSNELMPHDNIYTAYFYLNFILVAFEIKISRGPLERAIYTVMIVITPHGNKDS